MRLPGVLSKSLHDGKTWSVIKTLYRSNHKPATQPKEWNTVVGLEIHAQISTKSKLFSGASADFGGAVNSHVALFDASIPGTLPVLNKKCVEKGVLAAIALSCKVNRVSSFDRKHYFYADLPAGYQITQQRTPLAQDGFLEFQVFTPGVHQKPYRKTSKIKQIQLEQDSGKSLHDEEAGRSLVDLNRAGAPLMELVFEPDLEDGEEAAALVKELILVLGRLECCSGRMQEGAMRVDANVSVNRHGEALGTRTEVKNIGSVRGVALAIKHEAQRQISVLKKGGVVVNETRAWDAERRVTVPMRDKEVQQDYRYMPEPNLPPLVLNMEADAVTDLVNVAALEKSIPELPEQTRCRLIKDYGLTPEYSIRLVNEDKLLDYFITLTKDGTKKPMSCANILTMDLLTTLHKFNVDIDECSLPVELISQILHMLSEKHINLATARKIFDILIGDQSNSLSPVEIVDKNGWKLISSDVEIDKLCQEVVEENAKLVSQIQQGKSHLMKALLGQAAKRSGGRADMAAVAEKLKVLVRENSEEK